MTTQPRGAFIVLEGLDRAGKSTQHERLCEHFESLSRRVQRMRFPDRSTPIGASISAYLKGNSELEDHAVHLLFSANRWEAVSRITEAIDAGVNVIVDRYYYSGIVYTTAKNRASLDIQWCKAPDVGLPKPDLIIFLDVDAETQRTRGAFGEERYENEEMQKRVRELFYSVMQLEEQGMRLTTVVDASSGVDDVTRRVLDAAETCLQGDRLMGSLKSIEP